MRRKLLINLVLCFGDCHSTKFGKVAEKLFISHKDLNFLIFDSSQSEAELEEMSLIYENKN